MTPRPFARHAVAAAAALVVMLLAAPSAAPGVSRGPLAGPTNFRVAATTPHSVTLVWNPAVNSSSFTYVIEASFGYRVGVPQTQTSYTWTRDMIPGRTYSFVMWAGDAKGRRAGGSGSRRPRPMRRSRGVTQASAARSAPLRGDGGAPTPNPILSPFAARA